MIDGGWALFATVALVMSIAWDIISRARRKREAILRLFAIRDELTVVEKKSDPPKDAKLSAHQESLYTEAEGLLWNVGIDFRQAVEDIERRQAERREACRRLLEINEKFKELALQPDSMAVIQQEEELYSEAERLLRQLDMDPSKCLRRE